MERICVVNCAKLSSKSSEYCPWVSRNWRRKKMFKHCITLASKSVPSFERPIHSVISIRFKSLVRNPAFSGSMAKQESKCKVVSLDHLVLTVEDIHKSIIFYTSALGMTVVTFGENRKALQFGNQKINLHQSGREFKPYANKPTPGSADLCFVSEQPVSHWISTLAELGIPIEEGPVKRTGAIGPITSIYVRDPDKNLIEIANYGKYSN